MKKPTDAELKVLHNTIKKIEKDTERFSFNTGVSAFMICVNELTDLKCHKKEILEPLLILLAPYAPHIAEELVLRIRLFESLPSFPSKGEGRSEVRSWMLPSPNWKKNTLKKPPKPILLPSMAKQEPNLPLPSMPPSNRWKKLY